MVVTSLWFAGDTYISWNTVILVLTGHSRVINRDDFVWHQSTQKSLFTISSSACNVFLKHSGVIFLLLEYLLTGLQFLLHQKLSFLVLQVVFCIVVAVWDICGYVQCSFCLCSRCYHWRGPWTGLWSGKYFICIVLLSMHVLSTVVS